MRLHYSVLATGLCLSVVGCTTIPEAADNNLSRTDTLSTSKGMRGKRLQTAAPNPPIPVGAKLRIQTASFVDDADISTQITEPERALILNALDRNSCEALSAQFDIIDDAATADTYILRTHVTQLKATGKVGAAIGNISGFLIPVTGVRPPFGLGALKVEFEVLAPDQAQSAAMVWSRSADVISADAAVSRIGDAYAFTELAATDFSNLLSNKTPSQRAVTVVRNMVSNTSDKPCEAYGRQASRLVGLIGLMGVTVPPEMADKGRKPVDTPAPVPPAAATPTG